MDLFTHAVEQRSEGRPLAERLRPKRLEDVVGQTHLIGSGRPLTRFVEQGFLPSLIFWGPPGTGKTTLARILGETMKARLVTLSAVLHGVKELREEVAAAKEAKAYRQQSTILFVDEIHRFNKAQQDGLLPHVENGTVTLLGATTENPAFEVNHALLSRCRVVVLKALNETGLEELLERALSRDGALAGAYTVTDEARKALLRMCSGDARQLLVGVEMASQLARDHRIEASDVASAMQQKIPRYDRAGDQHYDIASAMIKSLRASDPDAALYWAARMLKGGEDPKFVMRRLLIFASEDIGNADPQALSITVSGAQALQWVGMPEAGLTMSQVIRYLAAAPKSNAALMSWRQAEKAAEDFDEGSVPLWFRNAPTGLAKSAGHGQGYDYPHNNAWGATTQSGLPPELEQLSVNVPGSSARERHVEQLRRLAKRRVAQLRRRR